jgi:hypothetical protein
MRRLVCTLVIAVCGVAVSAAIWFLTGGRIAFLFLPLLFAIPLFVRRR